ncbi:TAXI family TRAP transporter solute-binding subunit [Suttonella sp. R2A3]|uniref:TAXI family TRAP transporter solute-binding subunit n=1 Tax=Suttonella sp. R2A3 TaxID=2908648 RepID=UPI001F438A77|nr:TAXI family TRAP transporter solute-binding subunit [Suttonella sp. R2A3]UJF24324.1 TAXI family TRAP transporter solute-binding subunit [Suttonella sp. R2A3]
MKKSLLTLAAAAVMSMSAAQAEDHEYILATASTGGTYYPVGVALSTLTKVKLQPEHGLSVSAISSAGSDENIRLLANDEAQFAILQGLYGYYAWQGEGPMAEAGKQEKLRSVSMLWQNVEHFLIDGSKVDSGTVSDYEAVKGERMALGKRNSGTIGSNEVLFAGLGIDINKDFELMYGGYGPSADALQNGQVAGASIPAGAPAGAVTKLFAAVGDKAAILDVTDEQIAAMDDGRDLWTRYVIPKGTYVSVDRDVQTIAQPNLLATSVDVSEEDVYLITKAIYENLPFLQGIHSATKAMALEKAIAGLPLPLHPGAARYYQEQGIEIPERLLVD